MTSETYINKIMDETGLTPKEIQDLVKEKKAELKGLISDEGALLIIAKELMVDLKSQDKEFLKDIELKVKDITEGMKNIILTGRINEIYKIFKFTREDGSEGQVGSFLLSDESGAIRVVLWDDDTKILGHKSFIKNEIVKVINAYAKKGRDGFIEIHIGKFGKIDLSPEDVDHTKIPKITDNYVSINKIGQNSRSVSIEGKIIRKSSLNEFTRKDGSKGRVRSLTVIDSTGTIRIVFWNDDTNKIQKTNVGETYSITHLTPQTSNLKPDTYELVANANSKVKQSKTELNLDTKITMKIKELQKKENLVSFKGVITSLDGLREVVLKSGEKVSVFSFKVNDMSDFIRVSAWRDKAIQLSETLEKDKSVLIKNVKIRYNDLYNRNEVTFLRISEIEVINEEIKYKQYINQNSDKINRDFKKEFINIESIDAPGYYDIKGQIVKEIDIDKNELFIYDACPNCSKKITNCTCEEKRNPEKRMILKVLVDDESASIRTTFFGDKAERLLGKTAEEITRINDISKVLKSIPGKLLEIRGKATLNDFNDLNVYEFNVSDFKEANSDDDVSEIIEEIATFE